MSPRSSSLLMSRASASERIEVINLRRDRHEHLPPLVSTTVERIALETSLSKYKR